MRNETLANKIHFSYSSLLLNLTIIMTPTELLREILINGQSEEYDKQIYQVLKEAGELPDGYEPYWIDKDTIDNRYNQVVAFFNGKGLHNL